MTLTDGSRVRFVSCRSCEAKGWQESGAPLALTTVMSKARKTARPGPPPRRR